MVKKSMIEKRMKTWMGKQKYGQFVRDMSITTDKKNLELGDKVCSRWSVAI